LDAPSPTIRIGLAVAGLLLAILMQFRAAKHLRRGIGSPGHERQSEWVIRGFRDGILAIGLVCAAIAAARWSWPWALFAIVFLGEELVETGIMLLATKRRRRQD
jgi:fatty acid desaturase